MTPGSGVTANFCRRQSGGGGIAFDQHRYVQIGGRLLDAGQQVQIMLQLAHRRHEDEQSLRPRPAVWMPYAQGGVDNLAFIAPNSRVAPENRGGGCAFSHSL